MQFRVELRTSDWERLVALAQRERRTPHQQAAYLLERVLRRYPVPPPPADGGADA